MGTGRYHRLIIQGDDNLRLVGLALNEYWKNYIGPKEGQHNLTELITLVDLQVSRLIRQDAVAKPKGR